MVFFLPFLCSNVLKKLLKNQLYNTTYKVLTAIMPHTKMLWLKNTSVTLTKSISDNTSMYIGVYTKALVNSMSRCGAKLEWGTGWCTVYFSQVEMTKN